MECVYCRNTKLTMLNGTCFCSECLSYFKVDGKTLFPIFVENKEVYTVHRAVVTKTLLCSICLEREEREYQRRRNEEEHKEQILGKKRHKSTEKNYLCRECIDRINNKLREDKKAVIEPYLAYLNQVKLRSALASLLLLALMYIVPQRSFRLGIALVYDTIHNRRKPKLGRMVCFSLLSAVAGWSVYFYLFLLLAMTMHTYQAKRITYLENEVDVEKVQNDVLIRLKRIRIGENREEKRSFVYNTYASVVKQNEDVTTLCSDLLQLAISTKGWGGLVRVKEWMGGEK
ncbi:hypothetical protein NEDG_00319 [Nematocida displodere]|uniref:Uncharacterized protein n=1 Tax=Nematocida displodere TaxID=1805483 RepID=A0A177EIQ1_9MICR|nr:hypothetical protein NEDG_00319 [Nematocida displodere]